MTTCWVVVYFPQNLDTFISREESNLPLQLLLSLLQPSLSSHLKYLMLNKIVKREGTLPEGPPPLFACKAQKGPKRPKSSKTERLKKSSKGPSELSSMFKWWQAKDVALIVVPSILMFMGKSDMCHVQCTVGELKQHCPNKKIEEY